VSKQAKIYVAGHRGMVGSAIVRTLQSQGQHNIVVRTHAELDLTDQKAVRSFFDTENQTKFIWPLLRLVVFTPTTPTQQSSFTRI